MAKSNGFDGDACNDVERGGLEGVGLEIFRLKVQIWLLTYHMRQLQQVNYGIVAGFKTLQCELQRLKKEKREARKDIFGFHIDVSTTVIKSSFRTLKCLIRVKCEVEVSNVADGNKVLAERADDAGWTAVDGPQKAVLFDQWKERSKRQTRAAVSRTARDVARNKHVNDRSRKKKGKSARPSELLPCKALCFLSHQLLSMKAEETTPFWWSRKERSSMTKLC